MRSRRSSQENVSGSNSFRCRSRGYQRESGLRRGPWYREGKVAIRVAPFLLAIGHPLMNGRCIVRGCPYACAPAAAFCRARRLMLHIRQRWVTAPPPTIAALRACCVLIEESSMMRAEVRVRFSNLELIEEYEEKRPGARERTRTRLYPIDCANLFRDRCNLPADLPPLACCLSRPFRSYASG